MGRTNNLWVLDIYYDTKKEEFIKTIQLETLRDLAYVIGCELYDVSNFFHKITKPKGIFNYLTITKI